MLVCLVRGSLYNLKNLMQKDVRISVKKKKKKCLTNIDIAHPNVTTTQEMFQNLWLTLTGSPPTF